MKKIFLILCCWMALWSGYSQDTLCVVQYNLLNYGNYTSYCTSSVNPVNAEDEYLKVITDYLNPDIFSVNEMSPEAGYADRILNNVLNRDGVTRYSRITVPNIAGSDLVNMIYYNTDKVHYYSSAVAQSLVRDVDVVTFYYNGTGLSGGDTVFLTCVVAHLKAGDGSTNASERTSMVTNTLTYLKNNCQPGNYLFMGDLNLYSPTEGAFQNLTGTYYGTSWTFNDPANRVGEWHSNEQYADVHTQSTHSTSGCWASGGMDDRFDFILATDAVINGTKTVIYVPDSYHALGQDGNHFNKALINYPVVPLPSDVVTALYNNSDHLPVTLKLKVDRSLGTQQLESLEWVRLIMHAGSGICTLRLQLIRSAGIQITLHDVRGRMVYNRQVSLPSGESSIDISTAELSHGLNLLVLTDDKGNRVTRKLIVQ